MRSRGGRCPAEVLRTNLEIAIKAPVLPAETAAWASPDLTRSIATRIEESFLPRIALAGASAMPTTSRNRPQADALAEFSDQGTAVRLERVGKADKDRAHPGIGAQEGRDRRNRHRDAVIPAHAIDRERNVHRRHFSRKSLGGHKNGACAGGAAPYPRRRLLALRLHNLLATIETARADVVTQVLSPVVGSTATGGWSGSRGRDACRASTGDFLFC